MSESMIKIAQVNAEKEGVLDSIKFIKGSAINMPFPKNFFDISFCSCMLHHQKDPQKLIEEMQRITKNRGYLIVWDFKRPNNKFLINFYSKFFGVFGSKLMKKGYYDSLASSFTIDEIRQTMDSLGVCDFSLYKKFPHFLKLVWRK